MKKTLAGSLALAAAALAAVAADDPWTKVKELKSGAECRVLKTGPGPAVVGKFDELTDENLLMAVKNEQVAIPRSGIDRIECRPVKAASRMKQETKVTRSEGRYSPDPNTTGAPSQSVSSGLSIEGKPGYELVYRRAIGAPKK